MRSKHQAQTHKLTTTNAIGDHCLLPVGAQPCSLPNPGNPLSSVVTKKCFCFSSRQPPSSLKKNEMPNSFTNTVLVSTPSQDICSWAVFAKDVLSSSNHLSHRKSSTWQHAAFAFCWTKAFEMMWLPPAALKRLNAAWLRHRFLFLVSTTRG